MTSQKVALVLLVSAVCVAGYNDDGVTLTCGDRQMTVSLDKKTYHYLNASQLHLRDSSCKATAESATEISFRTSLNDCLTSVLETENWLYFFNEIQADVGQVQNVITRDHDFDVHFNCSYRRRELLSLSFSPEGVVKPPPQIGHGNLTFKLDFYKSDSFETRYNDNEYPLNVAVKEYLYVGYSVESDNINLVVMAVNCKATKDGYFYSSPYYDLIKNGCDHDTTMEHAYNSTASFQTLKLQAFKFLQGYDTVYFQCELLACSLDTPSSRCSQRCVSKKRRKREVTTAEDGPETQTISTKSYTIKRGPIFIFEEKEKLKDTGSTGKQAEVIAGATTGGGFGLLLIIGSVVFVVKYGRRVARLLLNRNQVGDLYATQDEHVSRQSAYIEEDDMIERNEEL